MDFLNPATRQSYTQQPTAYLRVQRQPIQNGMTRVCKQALDGVLFWIILACSLVDIPAQVVNPTQGQFAQQGSKLVGGGVIPIAADIGYSVALSEDGNTALIGYGADNNYTGAARVFTRNAGVWTQQGSKLVGSGTLTNAGQGYSVALSRDGNTALIGSLYDGGWVFTRNAGVSTQQGSKLGL